MALQASANVGAIKAASGLPTWLRGIGARQVRLACGLVMFSYIFLHFFIRHNGGVVAVASLVVAHPGCQRHPLHCGRDPFVTWPMGALSTTIFSLRGRRNCATCLGLQHSALARQSLRS